MIEFKIKLADFVFEIKTNYPDTKEMCKDYLTDEDSNFVVEITEDDISYENEKSIAEAKYEGRIPEEFTKNYLETIAVYRKIAECVAENNATVFHGCLVSLNNEGYLFTGRSGIGKSTHVNNWMKVYPECMIVNGDKPILKIKDDGIYGYGTPWSGKECLNNNTSVKIKAIISLTRDKENHIEEIAVSKALPLLVSATYRTNTPDGVKKALEMALKLAEKTKLYKLGCNMNEESAKVAYEGMNK